MNTRSFEASNKSGFLRKQLMTLAFLFRSTE